MASNTMAERWAYVRSTEGYTLWAFSDEWWLVIVGSSLKYIESRYETAYGVELNNNPIAVTCYRDSIVTLEYCRDTSPDLLFKLLGKRV